MLLFTLTALADPLPPAVESPLGITIEDGAVDVPTDAVPMFVYPSNGILPDEFTLAEGDALLVVDATAGGPADTPTASAEASLLANTTYTLSDTTTSVTFTTGAAIALPPVDAPSLAAASLIEPGGETGSGFYWRIEMDAPDETVVVEVDGLPIRVITPSMPSDFSWSRADDTTPFCVALRVRNAAGGLSAPGDPLCFGTPTEPVPTEVPATEAPPEPTTEVPGTEVPSTEPPTSPATEEPLDTAGCAVGSPSPWNWTAPFVRRR